MKNKILFIIAWAFAMIALAGCDDSTAGYTKVAECASVYLDGKEYMVLSLNEKYEEPGYVAEMGDKDITDKVQVFSDLNTGMYGIYTIIYRVTTDAGYVAEAKRYVVIADPSEPIVGSYTTDNNTYRLRGSAKTFYPNCSIAVLPNGDGTYSVLDFLGGYYWQYVGYGTDAALKGDISISEDGTIKMISSYIQTWGDSADEMIDGKFDAETGTITWIIDYAGMKFYVSMSKD